MTTAVANKPVEKHLAGNVMNSANQIWLAGLGAFAKTQEEGSKVFESLVKEGEKVEERTRKAANEKVEEVMDKVEEAKEKATEKLDKLEHVFQERVARTLNSLGVPSQEDIKEIASRIEKLDANVQQYIKMH